ncbi:2OG-Fe(II) oxygenase [Pseudomonas sp. Irchel 3F5]|uniref:2OG-Fe(II) oxygenase n=1 Tax=Pseudomonas sp. Irchel 3F5 TaxID=2009002 RepID=UPI000BA36054|nr:2OG-Fe(II) oxygenase [Pseudomonas sp. Irchel 3F5]
MGRQQKVTDELRHWLLIQRALNYPDALLHAQLLAAGWSDGAARQALAEQGGQAGPAQALLPDKPMPGPDLSCAGLYLDAGDRRVQVLQTMTHPRIIVFDDLLSEDECAGLISSARTRLERSLTLDEDCGDDILVHERSSDGMFFQRGENQLIACVEQRVATLLRWPVEFGEGLQVLRYTAGAEYAPHYDYFSPERAGTSQVLAHGGQRIATLLMYLQEPLRGGSTVFPDIGLEVMPKRGSAVFFSYERPDPGTRTLHGGSPVIAGEKWVATKWLREAEFD